MEICLVVISMKEEPLGMYCRIRTFRFIVVAIKCFVYRPACPLLSEDEDPPLLFSFGLIEEA